jgi:malate dehydrogenase (oxaloacetate-decarboxylating)(NADP+)
MNCQDAPLLVFIADTSVHELPNSEELASIAQEAAAVARRFGYEPRVAFLSYSTFGYPKGDRAEYVRKAVKVLETRGVDFEFDGEMTADVALSKEAMALYPFCRLTAPANVLVMPAAHSASISTKMLQQLGGVTVIGPLLTGLSKPVQIASMSATTNDILNLAAIAAYDVGK